MGLGNRLNPCFNIRMSQFILSSLQEAKTTLDLFIADQNNLEKIQQSIDFFLKTRKSIISQKSLKECKI